MREGLRALRKPSMCDESRGCLLAAMASWQLNRKEAAREWLSKGQEIIQNKFPKEGKDDIKEWPAWIHCQALLREAKELIREASAR
jgi:hypothetical protein